MGKTRSWLKSPDSSPVALLLLLSEIWGTPSINMLVFIYRASKVNLELLKKKNLESIKYETCSLQLNYFNLFLEWIKLLLSLQTSFLINFILILSSLFYVSIFNYENMEKQFYTWILAKQFIAGYCYAENSIIRVRHTFTHHPIRSPNNPIL